MDIGVRQLRESLSQHLALVREGHTITITSHGEPIARIVPVESPTRYEQLKAAGLIRPAQQPRSQLPPPLEADGSVVDLLDEQRR